MPTQNDSGPTVDKWNVITSSKFDKNYAHYLRDADTIKKSQQLIELLSQVKDPGRLGDRKNGRLRGMYTMKLTKSIRLSYAVDYDKRQIRLLDVGDHKTVYGRD